MFHFFSGMFPFSWADTDAHLSNTKSPVLYATANSHAKKQLHMRYILGVSSQYTNVTDTPTHNPQDKPN